MIEDFRSATCPTDLVADVCIIGAGPAGIGLAMELAGTQWTVCLVEGGGLHSEAASQALNEGESVGPHDFDPSHSRLRVLGGASRLWGGGCIPLSASEMAPRDWMPHSGWPIGWEELAPYYARANRACRVDPGDFDDGSYRLREALGDGHTPPPHLGHRTSRVSPLDFGQAYLDTLRTAPGIQLVLHANVLRLDATGNAAAVSRAQIGSIDGRRGTVSARCFVLATGGIENARLMLLSDDVAPHGLGNDHDLVGRYFMDHPRCRLGTFRGGDMDRLARLYSRPLDQANSPAYHQLSLSDDAQRRYRLFSARARPFAIERTPPTGLSSLRALRASLRRPARSEDEGSRVEQCVLDALAQDLPEQVAEPARGTSRGRLALRTALNARHVLDAGRRKLARRAVVDTDRVEMVGYFEQSPNRDSRISLSHQRDTLGLRKVQVDWRMGAVDEANIRATSELIGRDVAAHFNCEFEPADWLRDPAATPALHGTAHHIGTTRMSDSPAHGVVDRQCRVHGVDNLYVAGSSVFPTGGWSFPTLTIVALALRISDELRARLPDLQMLAML